MADLHSKILDAPLDLDVLIFMHFNENFRIFGRRPPDLGLEPPLGYPGSAPDCFLPVFCVVTSWSLTQEVVGSHNHFYKKNVTELIILRKHFGKTQFLLA